MKKEKIVQIADRVSEFSLYGLIFFIPLSVAGIEIFGGIAIIAFMIKKFLCPDFSFIKKSASVYFFLFAFVFFMLLSTINSGEYFLRSFVYLLRNWVAYILIMIVIVDTLSTDARIKNAIFLIMISTSLSATSALAQKYFGLDFFRSRAMGQAGDQTLAIKGSFISRNTFASYLIIFLPLSLALDFIKKGNLFSTVIRFFWTILLVVALAHTFSRGAWLGFLFGSVLLIILSRKIKFVVLFIFLFLLILLLVPSFKDRAAFTFSEGGDASRFFIWRTGIEMVKENPFLGMGLDTFKEHYPQHANRLRPGDDHPRFSAHNIYLHLWAEAGLFSLLSFLIFLGSFFYRSYGLIIKNRYLVQSFVLAGIISGVMSYLVHGFFDTPMLYGKTNASLWLMIGLGQAFIVNEKIFFN